MYKYYITNTILQSTIIPLEYHTKATTVVGARQMDRKIYRYDTSVKDVNFYFQTENYFSSNYYM